jgi:hypothetical protein
MSLFKFQMMLFLLLWCVIGVLHFFAVLYSFSLYVCLILMVERYNIFADSKKKWSPHEIFFECIASRCNFFNDLQIFFTHISYTLTYKRTFDLKEACNFVKPLIHLVKTINLSIRMFADTTLLPQKSNIVVF